MAIYSAAIPAAVCCLHDTDRSAWWLLLLIPIVGWIDS
jgi:uncharacterized membrane protein YhaH (DUF805 family)